MRARLSALLLVSALLTGCWGYRDINDLALVMAVGVDRTPEGRVLVTVQVARPGMGGGGQGAGSISSAGGKPVYVAAAEGRSVFEAIRNLALFTSRRIMWAHNKLVVIGEAQARHGVAEIIDFFTRNPELRYRSFVALAEGDARDVVSSSTGMEAMPADSIERTFRYSRLTGEAQRIDVKEFAAAYLDDGVTSFLPVLRLRVRAVPGAASKDTDPREVVVQGLALFRGDRLVEILDQQESRGVVLMRGRARRIVITLPCPGKEEETITLELLARRADIRPTQKGEELSIGVRLETNASLASVACPLDYRLPEVQDRISRRLEESLRQDLLVAIDRIKASRTDPVGLGQHVRYRLPWAWGRYREIWPEPLARASFQVAVKANIVGGELSHTSTEVEKERQHGK